MTVTEQARAGEFGRITDEIAAIRAKLNGIHEEGEETVRRAREASTPLAGEALVVAAHDQIVRAESALKGQLAMKLQHLGDLRRERNDLLQQQQEHRKFIAENESIVSERYERTLALVEQAMKLLDRYEDDEALHHLHLAC